MLAWSKQPTQSRNVTQQNELSFFKLASSSFSTIQIVGENHFHQFYQNYDRRDLNVSDFQTEISYPGLVLTPLYKVVFMRWSQWIHWIIYLNWWGQAFISVHLPHLTFVLVMSSFNLIPLQQSSCDSWCGLKLPFLRQVYSNYFGTRWMNGQMDAHHKIINGSTIDCKKTPAMTGQSENLTTILHDEPTWHTS